MRANKLTTILSYFYRNFYDFTYAPSVSTKTT